MSYVPRRVSVYQNNASVVRKFYHNGAVALNFCNPWQKKTSRGKSVEFPGSAPVKLGSKSQVELTLGFYAEADGTSLIGVGCSRKFEAFCNGTLCCSTVDEGTLYDAFAPENHPFLIPVKKGNNELKIFVRPGAKEELFYCKVLEKAALKLPVVIYAPVISHPDSTSLSLLVRTMGAVGTGVEYRVKNSSNWLLQWDEKGALIRRQSLHKFFLHDLVPGAEYEYRILMIDSADPNLRKRSTTYSFTVPPEEKCGTFSFFFTADPQFEPAVQRSLLRGVLESCDARSCDFLVLGGDINSRYSNARMEKDLIPTLQKYAGPGKAVIMLHGNHELRGPEADAFIDHWSDESGNTFYAFRFGDTAFLVLDSWENRKAAHPRSRYYSRHNLDDVLLERQGDFIRRTVNSATWQDAKRRIVFAHGAPYSHFDSAATMHFWLQEMTDRFFCGKDPFSKVNVWFAGHTHIYTRSIPGSEELTAFTMPAYPDKTGTDYIFPVLTCCGPNRRGLPQLSGFRVDAKPDGSLHIKACLPDGSCFEEIKINKDNSITEVLSLPHFVPEKKQ